MSAREVSPRVDLASMISGVSLESQLADADAILAAGYSKPRTITTVEELDALEAGTMILDSDPDCCKKNQHGRWYSLSDPEQSYSSASIAGSLPATVLYTPKES